MPTERLCSFETCGKRAYAKGFCKYHYYVERQKLKASPCSIESCDRLVQARGLCKMHYNSIWMKRNDAEACSIDGCSKPVLAQGLCAKHYSRVRNHGDPHVQLHAANGSGYNWILQHVDYDGDDCLIWPFSRQSSGYGDLWVGDEHWYAHRLMCKLAHGEPSSLEHQVLHSCGKGHLGCSNPKHLRYGTILENMADSIKHGTNRRTPNRKLTEEDVIQIRSLLDNGIAQKEISEKFGISRRVVSNIHSGRTWSRLL